MKGIVDIKNYILIIFGERYNWSNCIIIMTSLWCMYDVS